jgi:DNA topoisomerase-1
MSILVVVESPGKIKKITQILSELYPDKKFIVKASFGHIIDIDNASTSIDVNNGFTIKYSVYPKSKKILSDLKSTYKKCNDIYIATDKDREGEMIGWSIAKELKLKNPKRIVFGAITHEDIKHAIENVTIINNNMVDAQKVRRMKDRIIGYGASSTLPHKQSAGRVISVVTRIILDKEIEIKEFMKSVDSSYYKIYGNMYYKNNKKFKVILCDSLENNSNQNLKIAILNKDVNVCDMIKKIIKSKFKIENIEEKNKTMNSQPPFTTSTLQQEASSHLKWNVKKTMMIAQKLYEKGKITYMRTDSVNLSDDVINQIKSFIISEYGKNAKKYMKITQYKTKGNTQEGHEAIRPINIEERNLSYDGDESLLYNLIWRKTVASQMTSAKIDIKIFSISISNLSNYMFKYEYSKIAFDGYLSVYHKSDCDGDGDGDGNCDGNGDGDYVDNITNDDKYDNLCTGYKLSLSDCIGKEEYKKPPTRYNEALLIKKMDPKNLNIGRPSTYASTIERIQDKKYVEKKNIEGIKYDTTDIKWDCESNKITKEKNCVILGQEKNRLVPTEIGKTITEYLIANFPDIMEYKYTSDMEDDLDNISDGKKKWIDSMNTFYQHFKQLTEKAKAKKDNKNGGIMDSNSISLGKDSDGYEYFKTHSIYGGYLKKISSDKTKKETAPINKPFDEETINLKNAIEIFKYPKQIGKIDNNKVLFYLYAKYGPYLQIGKDKITLPSDITEDIVNIKYVKKLIEENKKLQLWQETDGDFIYTVKEGPWGRYICKFNNKTKAKPYNVKLPNNTNLKELTIQNVKDMFNVERKTYFTKNK